MKRNKSEARNPNFETNSNDRNRKIKGLMILFRKFDHLDFGFACPVKYGMTYFCYDFHDSFGKVMSSISNRIT